MAESRISGYDGESVTFWYKDHESGKKVEETVGVIEFIKKLIIHIPEKQFKMIRYYGIYAQHTKERPKLIKMVNEKIREIRRSVRNWRMRIMKTFGYDPLSCEKCGAAMLVHDIYYKQYGSVMERYRRRIEKEAQREIKEIEDIDQSIRQLTGGKIEPLFV